MIKIDENWYCEDCKTNYNCNNCKVMDFLIERYIIEYNKKLLKNIENKNICTCWNKKWKNSIMCRECYSKYKTNWEFW